MKYFTLFLLAALLKAEDPIVDPAVEDLDDYDYEQKRDYTHDLGHLCPNAPDTHAVDCEKNFKVSQYIKQLISEKELVEEQFE